MIPASLARQKVTITRREATGAGYVDTVIATGVPARIETNMRMMQTPNGTIGNVVTTAWLQPCAVKAGDRLTLINGTVVEIRSAITVYAANGTTVTMIQCEAW